jgi:hypothetical protein
MPANVYEKLIDTAGQSAKAANVPLARVIK